MKKSWNEISVKGLWNMCQLHGSQLWLSMMPCIDRVPDSRTTGKIASPAGIS